MLVSLLGLYRMQVGQCMLHFQEHNLQPHHGTDYYVIGLQIAGIGTLIGGINFLATIINMRAPGMTFMRMPMFTWASFITSALILFRFPSTYGRSGST